MPCQKLSAKLFSIVHLKSDHVWCGIKTSCLHELQAHLWFTSLFMELEVSRKAVVTLKVQWIVRNWSKKPKQDAGKFILKMQITKSKPKECF